MPPAVSAGLNEDYVHTVDAFELYLSRLNPGGYLSITRDVQVPPRDGLKMLGDRHRGTGGCRGLPTPRRVCS